MSGWRTWGRRLRRVALVSIIGGLLAVVAGGVVLQTEWAHERMRVLALGQANRWLAGTLGIERIDGSLLRGVELHGVSLTLDGERIIDVERVAVSYGLRELFRDGTSIRQVVLDRPRVVARQDSAGLWNLAHLLKPRSSPSSGARRPFSIDAIEIHGGTMHWRSPLTVGAVRVPTVMTGIDGRLSIHTAPGTWTVGIDALSLAGDAPVLALRHIEGAIDGGDAGTAVRSLRVLTERTELVVDGRVMRGAGSSQLDFTAHAARLDFQEWAGVLTAVSNINVRSALDARLTGPPSALRTSLSLHSTSGDIEADVVLDSTRPGWHTEGQATVQRLDLAGWLGQSDRPSDISGRIDLNLDLITPRRFPRGTFSFEGPHAAYLTYEADDVVATGTVSDREVQIASATATAYGANVRLAGSTIDLDAPYAFRFRGHASGVDLRQVPADVPVPHVASVLTFEFDTDGRFADPFIDGHATFGESTFLDASLGSGATGAINTSVTPFRYSGEGDLRDIDLNRFGRDLRFEWLADARYAGSMSGHFSVSGAGAEASTMSLSATGRVFEARVFGGRLLDGAMSTEVAAGTIEATYDGALEAIDPSLATGNANYSARLTGSGRGRLRVRDLMVREARLLDYTAQAVLSARASTVGGLSVERGTLDVSLADGQLDVTQLEVEGPALAGDARGRVALDGERSSSLDYRVRRADLSKFDSWMGAGIQGEVVTSGRLTGPLNRLRVAGTATGRRLSSGQVEISTGATTYDATLNPEDRSSADGTASLVLSDLVIGGRALPSVTGDVSYLAGVAASGLTATLANGVVLRVDAGARLDLEARRAELEALTISTPSLAWQLAGGPRPTMAWTETGVTIQAFDLVDASSRQQHLTADGTWDSTGAGQLRMAARSVSVDTLAVALGSKIPYAGLLNGTAALSGPRDRPTVTADFIVTDGRLQRLSYERFGGHVEYAGGAVHLDVRLDQGPGVWLTAAGDVTTAVARDLGANLPVRLAVRSSQIDLALLEGLTNVVRDIRGRAEVDVTVLGTTADPHFSGRIDVADAAFAVQSTGATYRNGRASLRLASDRVAVETLHIEDADGHALDVTGSLGTHELRVGDLRVGVAARGFQVLRNEFGRVAVDAQLNLSGEFESPRLTGQLAVTGGSVSVDRVLDRTLFQPYATSSAPTLPLDAISALNPWERMGVDVELHIPGTLRMTGDNVQVTPGTPLGLGNINLKVFGDLYLYKDPAQPLYVNGSLDSLSGAYAFQGRRFELDPASSIAFRGDLNPDLYVTVRRLISGVETRVSILGPLEQPELRLASTPPLDPSDILSLIVFNTSTNELSTLQQQQLAVRAGTLAAGFIAAPMVSALERTLGIDTLEIEPGADIRGGPRVTVGDEIAPGLIARFSRQFGASEYDEATLEYYLSRILRLRATFSDASTLTVSPFRRVERAGIDLLLFFSF